MASRNSQSTPRPGSKAGAFTVRPPLTVLAITPNTAVRNTVLAVTIAGSEFEPGATVTLTRDGSASIPGSNVHVDSSVQLTCAFSLSPTTATGAWNVVVRNPDGETATLPAGLAVFDRPPPDPVANLRVTGTTATSLSWAWTDPTVLDFVLVRTYLDNVEAGDVARGVQACTLTGLRPGTRYTFSTRAYDSVGNPSSWVNVTASTGWNPGQGPVLLPVPGGVGLPTDTDDDGVYDDVNGNGRRDFADVVLFFNQMGWIAANEPVAAFDCNDNGRIDFADVVWLFNHL